MAVLLGGIPTVDPASILPHLTAAGAPTIPKWWGKANSFATGPGAEPGRGYVLLRASDLARVRLTQFNSLTFSGEDTAHVVTLPFVTVVNAECVSPGSSQDANAVYLCEVADRRHFLKMRPVDLAYNVPTADGLAYMPNTVNSCVPWSWQSVVSSLAIAAGTGSITLPFVPNGTPENLIYWGSPSALVALADVLTRLGCALAYDPIADRFSAVQLGVDQDTRLNAITAGRTWDGYSSEPVRAWYPEKIRVRFLRRPTDGLTGASPYYFLEVTTNPVTGRLSGTTIQIDDDMIAVGMTGTPSNYANLVARATERATDWVRKRFYYDRPVLRAWRDFIPAATGLGGYAVSRVVFDDRGGLMQTWADAGPDGAMEEWRPQAGWGPWEQPPSPGAPSANPCPRSGSGSGSGSTANPPRDDYGWPDSEYPGDGVDPKAPVPACIGGYWYVPSYRTQIINVDSRLRIDYYDITVAREGCCSCPESGSGPSVTCCPVEPGTAVSAILSGPFGLDCALVALASVDGIEWDGTKWTGEVTGSGLTGTIELRCSGTDWYAVGVVTNADGIYVLLDIPLQEVGELLFGNIYVVSQTGCEEIVTLQIGNPCPGGGGSGTVSGPTVCDCTAICPDGTPYAWVMDVSGGTGDFAGLSLNGEWHPTNNFAIGSPCTWSQTKSSSEYPGWGINMAADAPFGYVDPMGRNLWWLTFSNSLTGVSVTYVAELRCCVPLQFELFATRGAGGLSPTFGSVPTVSIARPDQEPCVCEPPITTACCVDDVNALLYVTIPYLGLLSVPITYDAAGPDGAGWYSESVTGGLEGACTYTVWMKCALGAFELTYDCGAATSNGPVIGCDFAAGATATVPASSFCCLISTADPIIISNTP